MNLIRKLLLVLVAAAATIGPMAAQQASAGGHVTAGYSNTRIYWVYYRVSPHYQWTAFGGYYRANDALLAVNYIRYYGYEAFAR